MSVKELIEVKAPPSEPNESNASEARASVENALSISLPNDLIEFCDHYGSGSFGDTIRVYNPASPAYVDVIEEVCSCYRDLRSSEGDQFVPHEVFPASPGLFPWGQDVNGHMMFWLTEGDPDHWPIVLMSVDGESEQLGMPMTTFLAKILRREMSCVIWDEEWLRENVNGLDFNPGND